MLKKSLALLLTLCMVLALVPVNVFAAETTGYDTIQIPAELPEGKAVSVDGRITNGDGYHAYGVIANNVFTAIAENSTSQNYAMSDVAKALVAAQTHTYYFAQDDANYYFGIKLDRKSVNVDGYNYFTSQQTVDFKFGFDVDKPDSYVTVSLPIKNNATLASTGGLTITGKSAAYFCTEPAYANGPAFDYVSVYGAGRVTDNRTLAEGSTIGGTGTTTIAGASVFTYEMAITKASVKTILGEGSTAPSSIYFQASSTGARYASMNDLNLSGMLGCDSFDATFNLGAQNKPAVVEFIDVADGHEHNYVENPIDDYLVNKGSWANPVGGSYYYPVNPTAKLKCGEAAEYYKSCSICRAAGTEKFYGEEKAHSYVMRGDIVSSEITACNAANKSRIEYEYKCAWCDETEVLPWGDYTHKYVNSTVKINQRSYATCSLCNDYALVQRCAVGNHATTNTKYDPVIVEIPATCTTPAVTLYQCTAYLSYSYCTQTKTEKTAEALGHNAVLEKEYDASLLTR